MLFRTLQRLPPGHPASARATRAAALLGAPAPDLDLIGFFTLGQGQTHHHRYLPHWPCVWLGAMLIGTLLWRQARTARLGVLRWTLAAGGILHVLLDSLVGGIWWLAPAVDRPFALLSVTRRMEPWWLNFIWHPSFTAEILILLLALALGLGLWLQRRRRGAPTAAAAAPAPAARH